MPEFNPGKDWHGSRTELSDYSYQMLQILADHGVSIIGLLSWETNALDAGIKDSGVDDGVKRYMREGPGPSTGPISADDH